MLSAIDRIRTKLENNIEFKDITEIKHNDNNSKTFSYIQYKFNYNQVTMKLTVDEFGFYFIEFLKNTKNTKILISNLFNTFFVEHNNWELYNNEYTLDDVTLDLGCSIAFCYSRSQMLTVSFATLTKHSTSDP